jgi:hypothetical protein
MLTLDEYTADDGDMFWELCIENTIILHFILPHASMQAQPCDFCVSGITKRMITRLNRTPEGNMQLSHITKLVSEFHSACNPISVLAPFRNPGIVSSLSLDGIPTTCVDFDAC